jgi:hypothetical protein
VTIAALTIGVLLAVAWTLVRDEVGDPVVEAASPPPNGADIAPATTLL